jgi:adenylate kinase
MAVHLVSGVPGVGLSAVAERARRELEGFELVNFGDVMLEQAAVAGVADSRAALSALDHERTRRLQRRAGEYVADRAAVTEVLLTTHLAVETDAGFLPGLPEAVLRDVDPVRFVVVEADPATVRERRGGADREYGDASARAIEFEQDLNRTAAFEYAVAADAPVQLVENDADPEAGAAALVTALEG